MSLTIHHVVFAALMHDIGKVVQRSGAADVKMYLSKCRKNPQTGVLGYKHAMWTADFLSRHPLDLPDQEWDSIVELAGSHHCKDSWKMHNYDVYLDMIMQADHISSSWDREDPEEAAKDARRYLKVPLYSVFSRMNATAQPQNQASTHWTYPIAKLGADSVHPKPDQELKDQSVAYRDLLDSFEKEYAYLCDHFNGLCDTPSFVTDYFPQFIDAVDSLLQRYFWCVPANTMEACPVGSLYHHLHNSATIAGAMFARHVCGDSAPEHPFMIISADLNGIQNYLYDLNPENSTKASKLLRSRSFQIQMILEMAAEKVITELGLSRMNVFSAHGGKWFLLANHSPDNESKLLEIKRQLNQEMFERFLGSVSINLVWDTKIGLADLNKHHFWYTMQLCFDGMEREKHAKFISCFQEDGTWRPDDFVISGEDIYNDQICDFCKRRNSDSQSVDSYRRYESPEDTDTKICQHCLQEVRLGQKLATAKHFRIWQGDPIEESFISFGGMHFGQAKPGELEHPRPGSRYFTIEEDGATLQFPMRYLASQVPTQDDRVCTFENIAEQAQGLKANATLKGDVDNLGYIMSRCWPRNDAGDPVYSITDFSTLSFMIDYFFSASLPNLIRAKYPDSIYTVYSGGDDFCLVGAYDKVIDFAKELNQQFSRFCAQNPALHFSAAITLSHPKEPVKFVINSTNERLDDAKHEPGKNSLNLYETVVPWSQVANLMEFSDNLLKWLDNGEITLQFLYRLLAYHQMYLETRKNTTNLRNYLYDSLLSYDIKRNIEKERNGQIANPELVNTLKNLTGLQEGSMMQNLRIPLCHAIYKHRKR
ncbi:MAG TPA: type III-A CRISPR-associated protein Cas10/Csm1 [Candidatus Cloacimonadota bacterium]|nr:type III-A CRISPR-associated protein Cas10/Csm1 [Candidatus Cloacimonadota bacterium]